MKRLPVLLFLFALCPPLAEAQTADPTRWGIGIGFVPEFKISNGSSVLGKLAEVMYESGDEGLDVKGTDLRIGVVRGRRLGGEWGVSYIRRSFKEESTQGGVETSCFPGTQPNSQICQTFGVEYFYNDNVVLNGIEANRLFVLGTIKNVVQIGIDLGGGIGWMNGTAIRRVTEPVSGNFTPPPPNTTIIMPTNVTETEIPASTLVAVDPVPIGRAELSIGFILGRNVKVRASGGMNVPGTHIFSISTSVFLK